METLITDVLVIGAGAAGIRSAMAASEAGAHVVILSDGKLTSSGATFTNMTRGWGIQALIGKERTDKNLEFFYQEILDVGLGQAHPELVRILVEESGPRMEDLISYGMRFKRDEQGKFIRARGCFSRVERAFLTESQGNIKRTFLSIIQRSSVKIMEGFAVELILTGQECRGAWFIRPNNGLLRIKAKSTILATGGAAGIFGHRLAEGRQKGEGYFLAHEAGAELANLEFIQFMLGLKKRKSPELLPFSGIERPRALCDSRGRDILKAHIPDPIIREKAVRERMAHGPFSCRDISGLVDLCVSATGKEGKRVIFQGDKSLGGPVEVAHFSHAFNGGVMINHRAESTIPGLFAAGEVAAGPHGADRIGGCMMTATQVFGARAGWFSAQRAKRVAALPDGEKIPQRPAILERGAPVKASPKRLEEITRQTEAILDKELRILRTGRGLKRCIAQLKDSERHIHEILRERKHSYYDIFKTKAMITTGRLIAESALARRACLGSHYRSDGPDERAYMGKAGNPQVE